VQTYTVKKIQDTIGIDETVNVAIYVGKILPEKIKQKQHSQEKQNDKPEPNIPFHGYRA